MTNPDPNELVAHFRQRADDWDAGKLDQTTMTSAIHIVGCEIAAALWGIAAAIERRPETNVDQAIRLSRTAAAQAVLRGPRPENTP